MIYGLDGQRTDAGSIDVALNTPVIASRRIECHPDYFLRCDAVAGLTVEARRFGAVSWIAIETTPIDLSPDAGNVIIYEFRFTKTSAGVQQARINVGR